MSKFRSAGMGGLSVLRRKSLSRPAEERRSRRPPIPDATILVAAFTGLWFFLGIVRQERYFEVMGVPRGTILLPAHHYIEQGFMLSILLIFSFAAHVLVTFGLRVTAKEKAADLIRNDTLLAYVTVAALFVYLASWGDNRTPTSVWKAIFSGDWRVITLNVLAVVLALVLLVSPLIRLRRHSWLIGPSLSVQAFLVLVIIGSMGFHARDDATEDAHATLWGHKDHHEVVLYASATERADNRTFFLIAFHEGHYYLRDMTKLAGTAPEILVIPAASLHHVDVRRVEGSD